MKNNITRALLLLTAMVLILSSQAVMAQTTIDIPPPPGTTESYPPVPIVLPNGNFVVFNADYTPGAVPSIGGVFMYSPNGVLISTLTGSDQGDLVGGGGIKVLANGNFLVVSPGWHSDINGDALGAVTSCSGVTGCNGQVSASNSLVGGTHGDGGMAAVPLSNGDYYVRWGNFHNGSTIGAVTYCPGIGGTVGVPTTANTLFNDGALSITNWRIGFDELNRQLVISRPDDGNRVTIFRPAPAGPFSVVSGRVLGPTGAGVNRATVQLSDTLGNIRTVLTNSTGNFSFTGLENGRAVVIGVSSNKYSYAARAMTVAGNVTNLNFTPAP